jgi:hypothetical protein
VTPTQPRIDAKAEQRRQQQHHADQRAATELLLTDHGFVGFQRQHLIVATDHHRHTEIGDGQGEHQTERGEHSLTSCRPGDAAKGLGRTGAHARRGIEQSRIGQRQCREQDHQRMGKGVNHLAQHNPPEPVDVVREQPAQHALVAEQIDQRNARQHRRRHQRQQRNPAPDAFRRNQRALQRVGKQVGQRYDDGRNAEGNFQAVAEQPVEILAAHQLLRREPATALPGLTAESRARRSPATAATPRRRATAAEGLCRRRQKCDRRSRLSGVCRTCLCGSGSARLLFIRQTPAGCAAARRP